MTLSIYEEMKKAGVVTANYCSDLYAEVNEASRAIVAAYEFKQNVTTFQSAIEGEGLFFDIPFAFDPEWEKREARVNKTMEKDTFGLKHTYRPYRCTVCGHEQEIGTNHTGACSDICKGCSWKGEGFGAGHKIPALGGNTYRRFEFIEEEN